jgi:hypothetical protein
MVSLLIALTLLVTPSFGANGQANARKQAVKKDSADEDKVPKHNPAVKEILSTLDKLAEAQTRFADDPLRMAILCRIADLLWSYDQARARLLFEETFRAMAFPKGTITDSSTPNRKSFNTVRGIVVQTIVHRDPTFAVSLAASLPERTSDSESPAGAEGSGIDIRLHVALHLVPGNPELTLQVIKPLADKAHVQTLMTLLRDARRRIKHPKMADDLFTRVLDRAGVERPEPGVLHAMASYMFPMFPTKTDPGDGLDHAIVERFLNLALEVVSQKAASPPSMTGTARMAMDYKPLRTLLPLFDRFMPDRVGSYRNHLEEFRRLVPAEGQTYIAATARAKTIEELLAAAEAITELPHKDALYQDAAMQAIQGHKFEQASAILEKITNEPVRISSAQVLRVRSDQHRSQEISNAISKREFDKAQELIATNPDPRSRLEQTKMLIQTLIQTDRARGLQMLESAGQRLSSIENGVEKAQQLLSIAAVTVRTDPERGYEEVIRAVDEFNRSGFVPEWDKFDEAESRFESLKLGKQQAENRGLSFLSSSDVFYWLGNNDLQRALATARLIQMPEASVLAQLSVCRGAISKLQSGSSSSSDANSQSESTTRRD